MTENTNGHIALCKRVIGYPRAVRKKERPAFTDLRKHVPVLSLKYENATPIPTTPPSACPHKRGSMKYMYTPGVHARLRRLSAFLPACASAYRGEPTSSSGEQT